MPGCSVYVGIKRIHKNKLWTGIQNDRIHICGDLTLADHRSGLNVSSQECISRNRGCDCAGFVQPDGYVIGDLIVHKFPVQYNICDFRYPELHQLHAHAPLRAPLRELCYIRI